MDGEEVRTSRVDAAQDEMSTNVALIPEYQLSAPFDTLAEESYRKRYCFSMVMAVTTRAGRPCERACS